MKVCSKLEREADFSKVRTTADRETRDRHLRELDQEIKELQQHREECNEQILCAAKNPQATVKERQPQVLSQQLVANEQVTAQFQQHCLERAKQNQKMHKEDAYLRQELQKKTTKKNKVLQQSTVTQKTKLTLRWKTCHTSPIKM